MSNTFITPSIIARLGLATLYNNMVMAGLVWRDFDSDFNGHVGDTINIRKPAIFDAKTFTRPSGIQIQAVSEDKVPVTLDTIKDVSFEVTSEELLLDIDDFSARILTPAMMALVKALDEDLAEAAVAAALGTGGGGTVQLGGGQKGSDVIISGREKLSRNKLPEDSRYAVFSPEAQSVCLRDPLFVQAQMAGTTDGLRNANIGRAFGVDTYVSGTYGFGPGQRGSADGVIFHNTGLVLAMRPLQAPMGVAPNMYSIENYKGLSLRVVKTYDITLKQDVVSIDMLYGLKATRPQGIVVADFGQGS